MPLTHEQILYILGGVIVTLEYTVLALIIGTFLGAILSLCRLSPLWILRSLAGAYISLFRGTPLLVQLSLAYFALPPLLGLKISPFQAGILAFGLNSAAYVAEIFRSGIQSIPLGQFEAAKSLSISPSMTYIKIIFPQAIRNILPALTNEMISLLKESAIISVIGEADIMRRAQGVAAETYDFFPPLIVAGFLYYLLVLSLSFLASILEKRMKLP